MLMATTLWVVFAFASIPGPLVPEATAPTTAQCEAAYQIHRAHGGEFLLVLYRGKEIFARGDGFQIDHLHPLASGAKSFVGTAFVAAEQDGLLRLDDPAHPWIPEWKDSTAYAGITWRHLLTMTSGLPANGSERRGRVPGWSDLAKLPVQHPPGTKYEYGNTGQNLAAYGLTNRLRSVKKTFETYLQTRVMDRIGVRLNWRNRCADGNPQVAGGAWMSAKDWARFGEFIRRQGEDVLRPDTVAKLFAPTPVYEPYGLSWWLAAPLAPGVRTRTRAELPAGFAMAAGLGGQRLYVLPTQELTIVRFARLSSPRGYSDIAFLNALTKP